MSAFQTHTNKQIARVKAPSRGQRVHLRAPPVASVSEDVLRSHTVTTTAHLRNKPQQPRRKKLVFGWIQDVSGSMSGKRIEASLEGFDYVLQEVCQPTDYMGVVTYNGDLNTLHLPMQVQKIDSSRDKAGIRNGIKGNAAYDRMYDAVGASICGLQAMARDKQYSAVSRDAVYQLLLLTDGGDNYSSEFTLATLTELVAHPGLPDFHLVVVAVSMSERDKQKLRGLCQPVHATFLEVENLSELASTLHHVGEEVQQRLVVTTTTVTQTKVLMRGGNHRNPHLLVDAARDEGVTAITRELASTTMHLSASPPTRSQTQQISLQTQTRLKKAHPRQQVCQHFLAGKCLFGKNCRNVHPR